MYRTMTAQKASGKPAGIGWIEARTKFQMIEKKLRYIHGQQGATEACSSDIKNPYKMNIGGIIVQVSRENRRGVIEEGGAFQRILIKDPSKPPSESLILSRQDKNFGYTEGFLKKRTEGMGMARQAFAGTVRGVLKAIWIVGGAVLGAVLSYREASKVAGGNQGCVRKMMLIGSCAARGVVGAGIVAIKHAIWKNSMSFRKRMIKFIEDPANKEAVEALKSI